MPERAIAWLNPFLSRDLPVPAMKTLIAQAVMALMRDVRSGDRHFSVV